MAKITFARFDKYLLQQKVLLSLRWQITDDRWYMANIVIQSRNLSQFKFLNRIEAFEIWERLLGVSWTEECPIDTCSMKDCSVPIYRQLLNIKQRKHIGYILRRFKYILLKTILTDQRLKRKEDEVADNIYGFATSGTNVTSLILPLYSDVQKRVRFALCNKYMPVRYSVWHYKKKKKKFSTLLKKWWR